MVWWLATACDFSELKEDFAGLTNTLVSESLVLGVVAPEDDRIDLSTLGYEPGAGATVFLADASSVDNLDDVLVSGATVTADDGVNTVVLDEQTDGAYVVPPGAGLAYVAGNTMTVSATIGTSTGTGQIVLPPGANLSVAEQHVANEPLLIDVAGKGYTGSLVLVFDTLSGELTYSNEPQDIRAVYDLTRGTTELTTVTIPAKAFPGESVYALGFAGLVHTRADDFDNMNTLLSGIIAGQLEFHPIVTVPLTLP